MDLPIVPDQVPRLDGRERVLGYMHFLWQDLRPTDPVQGDGVDG